MMSEGGFSLDMRGEEEEEAKAKGLHFILNVLSTMVFVPFHIMISSSSHAI